MGPAAAAALGAVVGSAVGGVVFGTANMMEHPNDEGSLKWALGGAVVLGAIGAAIAASKATPALPASGSKSAGPVTIDLASPPRGLFPIVPGSTVSFNLPSGAAWSSSTSWATASGFTGDETTPGAPLTYSGGGGSVTLNWTNADGSAGSYSISFVDA